jgi:hypothetical protein
MKDEALKLALEYLKQRELAWNVQIALKEALALDKKAENARELGLDYEPVGLIDRLKAAQPAVQEPEIDGATMAGMDASIGHLSALVDELRLLLGCAMDNFKMLHNAAKPDDGQDMDAIIPAIVFAKFVNQDAALRYAIKHSAHDGMITTPPAAPKVVDCHATGVCVQSGLRAEMPAPAQPVAQAIIHAITEYGDARADQDANNAPTTSHERLADCIRLIRAAQGSTPPAQPAVPLTDDVVQKIISKLEPLLDAKNQSWAEAERMLHGITKGQP